MNKIALVASLVLAGVASSRADVATVQSKLQSALVESDETRLRITEFTESSEPDINQATKDELRSLLPVARKCLRSHSKTVQEYGLRVFSLTTFRPDSSELIAPYVDGDIGPFLDNQNLAFKRAAIVIIGTTNPDPLPSALNLLSSHLADKNNTEMEAGMIAASLIHGRPSDARSVHDVLTFVSSHPEFRLRVNMIQLLGLNNVTTEEASRYLRTGMTDPDPTVRRIAVEAVGHMPRESRTRFSDDLLRLLASPNETEELRSLAHNVLER